MRRTIQVTPKPSISWPRRCALTCPTTVCPRSQALLLGSVAAGKVTCVDEYDSDHLQMAVDAALMELQGTSGWFHELRSTSGYPNAQSVYSCTADAAKWTYPTEAEATGLLKRVLESGELKVAGVKWSVPGAADYKTDPDSPTGFW